MNSASSLPASTAIRSALCKPFFRGGKVNSKTEPALSPGKSLYCFALEMDCLHQKLCWRQLLADMGSENRPWFLGLSYGHCPHRLIHEAWSPRPPRPN